MVRTKKADPVELTHNVETCVCSDCKVVKLDEEVIQLKAKLADEKAWFQVHLRQTDDAIARLKERFEREAGIATPSRESLSRRNKLLEERVTDLENARVSKVVGDNTFETKVTQRLRVLEAGACPQGHRPVDIRDSDVTTITRELKKVTESLEKISFRLNPPF